MTQAADPYTSNPDQASTTSNDPAAAASNGGTAGSSSFFSGPSTPGQMLGYAAVGVGLGLVLNLLLSRD